MRRLCELNAYRDRAWERRVAASFGEASFGPSDTGGCFVIPVNGQQIRCIAGIGEGWDHVSVSHAMRVPSWAEMEAIKRHFFQPDEVAFQLHLPPRDHINHHPFCLHLWRPLDQPVPLPPKWMVA